MNPYQERESEFGEQEKPLRDIDGILEEYAKEHKYQLWRNEGNSPSRSMRWSAKKDNHPYVIDYGWQLFVSEREDGYSLCGYISYDDEHNKRYWKMIRFHDGINAQQIPRIIEGIESQIARMLEVEMGELEPAYPDE